jgi:predicted Zn-dependent protease
MRSAWNLPVTGPATFVTREIQCRRVAKPLIWRLSVTSVFGKKSGTSTINEFDDASLEKTVRRAEEIAKLAPDNPEYIPMLGPQKYSRKRSPLRKVLRQLIQNTGPKQHLTALIRAYRKTSQLQDTWKIRLDLFSDGKQ